MVLRAPERLFDEKAFILLDEISGKLTDMQAVGYVYPQTVSVTNERREISGQTFAVTIINDGPDAVYIWLNKDEQKRPWEEGEPGLAKNEKLEWEFRSRKPTTIYFICQPGQTASCRVWRLV